jgi:integrase
VGKLRASVAALLTTASCARLTVSGYASDVRVFDRWCRDAGRQPLPASAETLAMYVAWSMTEAGRKVTTMRRHLAAIVDSHRRAAVDVPSFCDARLVVGAVRRTRGDRPQGKAALSVEDLARIAKACDLSTARGIRDRVVLVLGFATALRRSELAALQLADVSFHEKGVAVVVRRSKTDQQAKGRLIAVWAGERGHTDPVRVLQAWMDVRGNWPGPLFCRVLANGSLLRFGINGDSVNDLVKRSVAAAGLDPALYGSHSLRAGAVTASAELGRSDQEIMGLSGHADPKVMRMYVRSARLFSGRNPLAGVL